MLGQLLLLGARLLKWLTCLLTALSELLTCDTSLLALSSYATSGTAFTAAATGIGIPSHGDLFAGTMVGAFQRKGCILLDLGTDLHTFLGDLAIELGKLLLLGGNILALAGRLSLPSATRTAGSAETPSRRGWTIEAGSSRCSGSRCSDSRGAGTCSTGHTESGTGGGRRG